MRYNFHNSVYIHPNVCLGNNVEIQPGSIIGALGAIRGCRDHKGKIIIEDNVKIGANCVINIGAEGETRIAKGSWVMNMTNIGHNVMIGEACEIGAHSIICGHCEIGDEVIIKSGVIIRNRLLIMDGITIGMGAVVTKDLTKKGVYYGNPARQKGEGWECYG